MVYTASTAQYLIIQGPDGSPVAVPVQAVDGMVTVQVPRSQGSQPPMVLMPSSGAVGGEPHAVEATGYPPQEGEMPSLYGYGQYTPQNEEVLLKGCVVERISIAGLQQFLVNCVSQNRNYGINTLANHSNEIINQSEVGTINVTDT